MVKLGETVAGKEKNDSAEEESKLVIEFLNCPGMSYTTLGRKGNIYLGTFQKVKRFAQKHYLF